MQKYTFNFQIGDLVFFKKVIPLANISKGKPFGQKINSITDLLVDCKDTPHFFRRVELEESYQPLPMTTQQNKLFYVRNSFPNYYLRLDCFNSFEEYMGKFSGKTRSTLNRKFRNALSNGFSYKAYSKESDVDEFHKLACSVGEKTYQHKLFNSSIPSDDLFKAKIKSLAIDGHFLGFILFHENEPCAYLYCPIIGGNYIYSYLGYLKKHSESSPGTVLQIAMLMHVYQNPPKANIFDFTEGEGKHKETFATDKAFCCSCLILNNSFSNRMILRVHISVDKFSKYIGEFLGKYNLREKIKKMIRKAAS